MNKSRSFKTTYTITFNGRSKYFEGDKMTFMETMIYQTINGLVEAYKHFYKTLKIDLKKE